MARLALVAILLLALVPTLGRIAQARAASVDAVPSWASLCTAQGLRQLSPQAPLPSTPRAPGDCAYCPLLAATVAASIAVSTVPPPALPTALCTSTPADVPGEPHPVGLGSRGPPFAS
jgi:hypothetical protein